MSRSNSPIRGFRGRSDPKSCCGFIAIPTARFARLRVDLQYFFVRKSSGDVPATVLLPTPPLPLATTTTFLTCEIRRFAGRPRVGRGGGAPDRGKPGDGSGNRDEEAPSRGRGRGGGSCGQEVFRSGAKLDEERGRADEGVVMR